MYNRNQGLIWSEADCGSYRNKKTKENPLHTHAHTLTSGVVEVWPIEERGWTGLVCSPGVSSGLQYPTVPNTPVQLLTDCHHLRRPPRRRGGEKERVKVVREV